MVAALYILLTFLNDSSLCFPPIYHRRHLGIRFGTERCPRSLRQNTDLHLAGKCAVIVPSQDVLYADIAREIGNALQLDTVEEPVPDFDQFISIVPAGNDNYAIAIQQVEKATTRKVKLTKPMYVDFEQEFKKKRKGPELLLQALPRGDSKLSIWDVCAGWGRDALVMANTGHSVHMVERNTIMALLLEDGLRRKRNENVTLTLEHGDAIDVLRQCPSRPDIIYLDPMFPPSRNSALVKKDLQILHGLVGPSVDSESDAELFESALRVAKQRVIVKRSIHGEPISVPLGMKPSFQVVGSTNRWDVYMTSLI